ncbi:hypothetical protein J3R03_008336 [Actinoplanes couchii]|nr:hypothetical protein [Actinoplanes couchii]
MAYPITANDVESEEKPCSVYGGGFGTARWFQVG